MSSPAPPTPPLTIRQRVYEQIDPQARDIEGLSNFNKVVILLVVCASVVAVLQTEPSLKAEYGRDFFYIELTAGVFFLIEYVMRLWTAPEIPGSTSPGKARLKFVFSAMGLLDLLIIVSIFTTLLFQDSDLLTMLRILRILQLARLTRFSRSLQHLANAVYERRYDLCITMAIAGFLLLFGATALYWIEGKIQPEEFGSIPRALWWAVITLTTVGYGDVSPITTEGKLVASFIALAGIALVALPTGILAAAFSDGMQRQRQVERKVARAEAAAAKADAEALANIGEGQPQE